VTALVRVALFVRNAHAFCQAGSAICQEKESPSAAPGCPFPLLAQGEDSPERAHCTVLTLSQGAGRILPGLHSVGAPVKDWEAAIGRTMPACCCQRMKKRQ
jgi:hypothetical protein